MIDALCINQQDVLERNALVRLMQHIFSKAECVLVWLGVPQKGADLVLPVLSRLSCLKKNEDPSASRDAFTAHEFDIRGIAERQRSLMERFTGHLLEILVFETMDHTKDQSCTASYFMLGSDTCSWESLVDAACFMGDHSLTALTDADPAQVLRLARLANSQANGILELAGKA